MLARQAIRVRRRRKLLYRDSLPGVAQSAGQLEIGNDLVGEPAIERVGLVADAKVISNIAWRQHRRDVEVGLRPQRIAALALHVVAEDVLQLPVHSIAEELRFL